jgi:spore coat polysaccharide biosynthesis protein SpsF
MATKLGGGVRIVGVIQARTGSARLPRKVLMPAGGRPLLQRMIERVLEARELDAVIVATTRLSSDSSIRALSDAIGIECISGDASDLLDRHLQAARALDADVVVKIPSDCPLVDPRVIDQVVSFFRRNRHRYDFVSNLHPPSWPAGNDVEVIPREILEIAGAEARRPFQREHTTPFIWDQPERFRVGNVRWDAGVDLSARYRLALEYEEDYRVVAAVFEALHRPKGPPFGVEEIVNFLDEHPSVRSINARHLGSDWMDDHATELRTRVLPEAEGGQADP